MNSDLYRLRPKGEAVQVEREEGDETAVPAPKMQGDVQPGQVRAAGRHNGPRV